MSCECASQQPSSEPDDAMYLLLLSVAASVTLLSGQHVTQNPTDLIEAVGRTVRFECFHNIVSYNTILLYQQRGLGMQLIGSMYYATNNFEDGQKNVKFEGSAEAGKTCTITISALHPKSSGVYYCAGGEGSYHSEVFFGGGTRLTVTEPNASITLPKVTLFPPSAKECTNEKDRETKKKTLVCAANDFYPDHVSVAWMVDGQKRETGVATDPEALKRGASYSITSRLRVPADEWSRGSRKFTCVVRFFDGKDYVDVPDSIFGNDDAEDGQSRESFLKLTQSAKLSYGVLIAKSCVYAAFVAFLLWRIRVGCSQSLSCPEDGRGKRIALNSL